MEGTDIERLLSAVVETAPQPYVVLNDDYRIRYANPAFYAAFRATAEETRGRDLFSLGNGHWDVPALRHLLEEVLPRDTEIRDFRIEHAFAAVGRRVMLVNARRIPGDEQRAPMILLAISDVTERERLETELIASAEFNEKLIDSVREMILVLDPDLKVVTANAPFYACFQVSAEEVEGRRVYTLGNGQWDIPELRRLLEEILPKAQNFDDYLIEHDFEKIGRRVMSLNARRLDHLPRILLAIRDLTESRRHEARQSTMVAELQHRVKNILANVNALARLTHERSASLQDFRSAFEGRLFAMARTQELLVRGADSNADLAELVRDTLDVAGTEAGRDFSMDGPRVTLSMREAEVLGLVLHELTTNAAKHGALATPGATIEIAWSAGGADKRDMAFSWTERGLINPEKPAIPGFGTMILEESAPYMLGGSASLAVGPGGIAYKLYFRRREV